MAKKQIDESPLSMLDQVASNISGDSYKPNTPTNMDDAIIDDNDDDVIDLSKTKAGEADDDADLDNIKVDLTEDDVAINDDKDEKKVEPKVEEVEPEKNDSTIEPEVADSDESTHVELFFDAFAEQLGWEAEEGVEKPKTIEEFVNYIQDLIEEESTPQYSDPVIAELDEYVKNGGNFEDFYKLQTELTSLDNLDLSEESNQKAVVTEYLKLTGNTDSQIQRKIKRWEDAGTLEDEAEDNLEALKEIKDKQKETSLKEQEQQRLASENAYKEFHTDVIKNIDSMVDVRGIKIPAEDRKRLKDYAFKVEADGTTRYQKDYAKNLSRNFIESAYFTMKGDALITTAKKVGETSAAEKLRASLKNKTSHKSKQTIDNTSASPIWSAASSLLMGNR